MKLVSLVMIILISQNSAAQTCQEVLNNCNAAYNAQKVLIKDQKDQIDNYYKKDQLEQRIIEDQKNKLDSPARDPIKMLALGGIGVIILEIVVGGIKK